MLLGSDSCLGATAGLGHIYRIFTGGEKHRHDHDGYTHCSSARHPDLAPETIALIEKGLGRKNLQVIAESPKNRKKGST